jgi:NAD-dependent dihydropyrimidine dehydrogenase PreA subunit
MTNLTDSKVYQRLRKYLDGLPGGFVQADNDADIRLLKNLYAKEEAELALYLTLSRENASTIANRAGLPIEEVEERLNTMAEKGLIISIRTDSGILYQAAPWVVGIYEFQVNRLSDEFIESMNEYYKNRLPHRRIETIPQMRTIPVYQSLDTKLNALPYEKVEELVDVHSKFAVAPCICRTKEKKQGRGCDAPIETCIMFGDFADFYTRTGRGRSIDKEEVRSILEEANKANLVLNPTNSKFVSAICCCCGDCCGVLQGLKSSSNPSESVASNFIVEYDSESCIGCGVCVDRCQMEAITLNTPIVDVNTSRCIGCGLCVTTCPGNALTLKRKTEKVLKDMPETVFDTWIKIANDQSKSH